MGAAHGHGVRRSSATHIDLRRKLLPRQYLDRPDAFGRDVSVRWVVPAGGDEVSLRVARLQHELVVAWRVGGARSGAATAREFGFSRQTWSRITLGERWMGETGAVALVTAIRSSAGSRGMRPTVEAAPPSKQQI